MSEESSRLSLLDALRGVAVLLMATYHGFYNLRYIFGNPFGWTARCYLLQQAACWSFILIGGFSFALSRSNLRRGLLVSGLGLALTAVTCIFMPEERIIWGVLSFHGAAMLLTHALRPLLSRIPARWGLLGSAALFFVTRDLSWGYLGFERIHLYLLPEALYQTPFLFPLGLPSPSFWSSDYFPLVPWIFLFWVGFYLYTLSMPQARALLSHRAPPLELLGRHALLLYLIHQPLLFGCMWLLLR